MSLAMLSRIDMLEARIADLERRLKEVERAPVNAVASIPVPKSQKPKKDERWIPSF